MWSAALLNPEMLSPEMVNPEIQASYSLPRLAILIGLLMICFSFGIGAQTLDEDATAAEKSEQQILESIMQGSLSDIEAAAGGPSNPTGNNFLQGMSQGAVPQIRRKWLRKSEWSRFQLSD